MTELASILEREGRTVDLEPGDLDRLFRRRDRRRRNRRIGSALLAIAFTAAMIGSAFTILRGRAERVPMDRITSGNVARLELAWVASAQASTGTSGSPSVRDGIVYADMGFTEGAGGIQGFPLACPTSGSSCPSTWRTNTSHELSGIVLDDAHLYVGEGLSDDSPFPPTPTFHQYRIEAFDRSCASDRCRPTWVSRTADRGLAPITQIGDRLYVRRAATLQAYAPSCGHHVCEPVWAAPNVGPPTLVDGRAIVRTRSGVALFRTGCWTAHGPACPQLGTADTDLSVDPTLLPPPLVTDGHVLLDDSTGIEAFSVECHGPCQRLWHAPVPGGPGFEPVVANGSLFTAADGGSKLYAFRLDCETVHPGGSCAPAWVGHSDEGVGFQPIVVGDRVIVGTAFGNSLAAYPISCTADCQPAWTAHLDDSITFSPVVSDDVVLVSGMRGVTAFAEGCTDPCQPLFHWDAPTGSPQMSPLVEGDALVVVIDHSLYTFRLGSSGEAIRGSTDGDRALPFGVVGIGLGAVVVLAAIRRRRSRFS